MHVCSCAEQKKQKLSEIRVGLEEAESLIRKMDVEARSLQPNVKAVLLAKLREYKSDLNNLKSEVKRISSANLNQAARDELLESGMPDASTVSADQKARLLMSTERLNKTGDRVRDSRRTMLETEELGVSILQDLNQQRQSLLHAHGTLHGVDDNIGKSKKITTNMSRRMSRNNSATNHALFETRVFASPFVGSVMLSDHIDGLTVSATFRRMSSGMKESTGEQKKQKLSEIRVGLEEAESLIRKMDVEARSLQPNVKAVLLAKLREYKSDLNNLKSEVKRISSANLNQAARDEWLESGMADASTVSADQKARLLMSTERLNKTDDRVRDSRRTMLETEELGVSILQDLNQQRQSLLHAHGTLHGVDDNIGKSKKITTNMSRRMSRNKWIIGSIVAVLVLTIILILYFKLKN
nr:vesicle transport v-SNARE 13 [Tanacetum cinerariifolium]